MKYWTNIQERFNETINILKNNFLNYLLLNLGLLWIWLVIFLIIWGLAIFSMFLWFWLSYTNYTYLYWNFSVKFLIFVIFLVLFLFLIFRILKATIFIWNFYLTKYIDKWKEIKLSKLFLLSYKKLYDRALVDLWYFIIYLWVFILMWVLILIGSILFHVNTVLFALFMFASIIWICYLFVYISIKYYFADYYCFDNKKFSFKHFKKSTNITQKTMMWVFWNILLIMMITYVISAILWLLLNGLNNFWSISSLHNSSAILWLLFSFWFITFIIIKYIFNLLAWLFWFVYMYIYYNFLSLDDWEIKNITEEVNKQLDVKDL